MVSVVPSVCVCFLGLVMWGGRSYPVCVSGGGVGGLVIIIVCMWFSVVPSSAQGSLTPGRVQRIL